MTRSKLAVAAAFGLLCAQPLMTQAEIFFLEELLVNLARKAHSLECLEWGAGGSTLHFAQFLDSRGLDYKWVTLEHDRQWYDKVKVGLGANPGATLLPDSPQVLLSNQVQPLDISSRPQIWSRVRRSFPRPTC